MCQEFRPLFGTFYVKVSFYERIFFLFKTFFFFFLSINAILRQNLCDYVV